MLLTLDKFVLIIVTRRETYATPRVKVAAANPYATVESSNNLQPQSAVTPGRPSESWKEAFIRRFKTMREVRNAIEAILEIGSWS